MEKPYPWLVFVGGENQVFSDVVSDPKYTGFTRCIQESKANGSVLMPTNINGWLLILAPEETGEVRLWNAVTLQSIHLPLPVPLPPVDVIDYVFLTKSPDDADCVVLLFVDDPHPRGILHCYVNGDECDDRWTFGDYQEEEEVDKRDKFICPVACDDDNIFMSFRRWNPVLAKIETVKPKRLVIRPDHLYACLPPHLYVGDPEDFTEHCVACCGDLFIIELLFDVLEWKHRYWSILVSKLDFSDMSWKTVNSCPNTAFFISGKQCLACPIASPDSGKVGNRVYIVENEGNVLLHTYHIEQKTLKACLVAAPINESGSPYWMLVPDALAKDEEDCRHMGGDGEKDHSFDKSENSEVLMVHSKNRFEDLPVDILKIMASYMHDRLDYLSFRATSRWCREVGSAQDWIDTTEPGTHYRMPWLLFPNSQEVGKGIYCMVDPDSRLKLYSRTPDALGEASRIRDAADGWLLISSPTMKLDSKMKLWLYNPVTKSAASLPEMAIYASYLTFSLRDDNPMTATVIGASLGCYPTYYSIMGSYTNESGQEWDEEEFRMTTEYEEGRELFVRQSNANPVLVDAGFYFLIGDGNLACISEQEDGSLTVKIHGLEDPCSRSSCEEYFLVECEGDLLAIYLGKEWKWLRAFKFNESDMVWDEVKELKNNNLYLSNASSTTLEPLPPQIGNRIYFSIFYQGSIVYYSFNTNKFHISDGRDSVMTDYYGLEWQMYSCWFVPTF